MNNNIKSATTAGLLGIFLGAFGAHDWYLGDKKKGAIHVALAGGGILLYIVADAILPAMLSWRALSAIAWLILMMNLAASAVLSASSIWGFIEGIMILAKGDVGLAQKGYMVANPNMGYNNQGYGNQGYGNNGYNNYGGQNGMQNGMMQGNMQNGGMLNNGYCNYNDGYNMNNGMNGNMNMNMGNMPQMGNGNQGNGGQASQQHKKNHKGGNTNEQ